MLAAIGVALGTPNSIKILNIFISGLAISRLLWLLEKSAILILFHLGFTSTFRVTYNFGSEQKLSEIQYLNFSLLVPVESCLRL